jgi:hypothetical protein
VLLASCCISGKFAQGAAACTLAQVLSSSGAGDVRWWTKAPGEWTLDDRTLVLRRQLECKEGEGEGEAHERGTAQGPCCALRVRQDSQLPDQLDEVCADAWVVSARGDDAMRAGRELGGRGWDRDPAQLVPDEELIEVGEVAIHWMFFMAGLVLRNTAIASCVAVPSTGRSFPWSG